jgi:vitamin B12 transporter
MFGTVGTYSVGAAAVLPWTDTVLRLNQGTGFKAPSLVQLKDPAYGNPDLKPERNRSFEAGVEQPWKAAGLTGGATFFVNSISQLISTSLNSTTDKFEYFNIAAARIVGLEAFAEGTWRLGSLGSVRARADYTWMEPKDTTKGEDLVRRARNKASLAATWSPVERASFTARVGAVGARRDTDFGSGASLPAPVTLDPYVLVSLMARYDLSRSIGFFARVENLFNARYQEVFGYGTPGLSAFGGVRVEM